MYLCCGAGSGAAVSGLRSQQRSISTSTDDFIRHPVGLPSSPSGGYSTSIVRTSSPSVTRRQRSQSLSQPGHEMVEKRVHSVQTYSTTSGSRRSPSPRRQRSHSLSGTGHASPLLQKREQFVPRNVHSTSSPPPYKLAPITTQRGKNLEQLVNQDMHHVSSRHHQSSSSSGKYPTHRQERPGHGRSHSVDRSSTSHGDDSYSSRRHSVSGATPTHRSPLVSPQHSIKRENITVTSDARQRRAAQKRQESVIAGTADSDVLRSTNNTGRTSASVEQRNVLSNSDNNDPAILQSVSRSSLRRSNSTSSMADFLKLEEEKKSSTEGGERTAKKLSSRGSFDDIREVEVTERRRKTQKHRIKSLLKKIMCKLDSLSLSLSLSLPPSLSLVLQFLIPS